MPTRHGGYTEWLNDHVIPKWEDLLLEELELLRFYHWIKNLQHAEGSPRWKKGDPLPGKTTVHIKRALRQVFEFAILAGFFRFSGTPWKRAIQGGVSLIA